MILKKFILALLISSLCTACSPFKVADILSPYSGYTVKKDLSYGTLHRQTLDVYTPTGKLASEDIVIFFYGGSWKSGEKSNYRLIAQPFAEAGFKTILPNYRLYPEVKFPEFVADAAKAVAWVYRQQPKTKPSKIILIGHSAGAHIAALLALNPYFLEAEGLPRSIIKAWVSLAGPLAFNPLNTKSTRPIFETARNNIKQTQPISFANKNSPPAILFHGKDDKTVYEKNSIVMAKILKENGNKVIHKSFDGLGHIGLLLSIAGSDLFEIDVRNEIIKSLAELSKY